MPTPLPVILIGLTIALIAVFVFRPQITQTLAGKMAAFLALFALPVLCAGMGASSELVHAKSTKFCLSCHIMKPYGQSSFAWMTPPIWRQHIFKTAVCLRTMLATHATRITQCSVALRPSWGA